MYQSESALDLQTRQNSPILALKVHAATEKRTEPKPANEVRASEVVAKGSITREFSALELLKACPRSGDPVKVAVTPQGFLSSSNSLLPFQWVRLANLARDVHESNAVLEKVENLLVVRVIKTIEKDAPVFLWFSEEVSSFMNISFLRLENIKGQYHYRCHECGSSFENPNPLKIHIATDCETYPTDILFKRLAEALQRLSEAVPPAARFSGAFSAFLPQQQAPMSYLHHSSTVAAASHLETIVSNMGTSKDGHVCIYCGKLYSRKYGLKIHIRTHTGFKPLKCKFCLRPFGDPSNLNKHLRLHAQSGAAHKCTFCNKVMVRKRDLERHQQTRHGIPLPTSSEDLATTTNSEEEDIDVSCDS